ncbi:T9SS type A sorting domain-containing protein [bacterium SCSIO 12741]|nr:T9SS type A sorting domain-containing protein [bacterium SCSIO 12741]
MKLHVNLNAAFVLFGLLFTGAYSQAQQLTEVTGKRLYDHHSDDVLNPDGSVSGHQSGYDFVKHDYFDSFDPINRKYQNGEEKNLDMVEHNGPSVPPGLDFGVTAGASTMWNGDITGNGLTKWVKASAGFNYATITDMGDIESEYNAGTPSLSIETIEEGAIYVAKIRDMDMYVAMKCYAVVNPSFFGNNAHFDFDYKYGSRISTNVAILETESTPTLSIFPNPASNELTISNGNAESAQVTISYIDGQVMEVFTSEENSDLQLDISSWDNGVYFIHYQTSNHQPATLKFIKN